MAEQVEDPGKALRAKSMEEFAKRMKGKPTPTQDENDRAALGEHILEHEADGSDEEQSSAPPAGAGQKQSEAKPGSGGSYRTRQTTPSTTT